MNSDRKSPTFWNAANVLYGVTMQEDGVSKLLRLDLEQVTPRWFPDIY